eukprot:scaffold218653_cov35-Tisochrysis_lutea.AAC.2
MVGPSRPLIWVLSPSNFHAHGALQRGASKVFEDVLTCTFPFAGGCQVAARRFRRRIMSTSAWNSFNTYKFTEHAPLKFECEPSRCCSQVLSQGVGVCS